MALRPTSAPGPINHQRNATQDKTILCTRFIVEAERKWRRLYTLPPYCTRRTRTTLLLTVCWPNSDRTNHPSMLMNKNEIQAKECFLEQPRCIPDHVHLLAYRH
mmetsp:Transcript_13497/g.37949  ORF Transcript_13497/g.37949 Transcript_13497/m.37949 type:complete len:104 (+) Transcript_13497:2141-2452(+)